MVAGKPTVRKAQSPGREQGDPKSECRWPKGGTKPGLKWLAPPPAVLDNWPDTGLVPGPERVPTRVR